ncbi:heme oxygenase 2-like [Lampetra fluviatilis]
MPANDSQDVSVQHAAQHGKTLGLGNELSDMLKVGTKDSHTLAENTHFVKEFLQGRIRRDLFEHMTVALYHVYTALEEEMERNKGHAAFAPLHFPLELSRKAALEKDLHFFYGPQWQKKAARSDAVDRYVERIRWIGEHEPELLVSHAYTRYMGDLSGGQVLKKVAQRALHLPASGEGLEFYTFDNVTNAGKFKQLYRSRMNSLELNAKTMGRVVEEANNAFRMNMEVFKELDAIRELTPDEKKSDSSNAAPPLLNGMCSFHTEATQAPGGSLMSRGNVVAAIACAVAVAVVCIQFLM